jgi:hypothetical protein
MIVSLIVKNAKYDCDITDVQDHPHPDLFDGIIKLPDDFMDWEDGSAQCATIFKAVNDQLGLCMYDGELSICDSDNYDGSEGSVSEYTRIMPSALLS